MYQKKCTYCKKKITYTTGKQFSSHCANCEKRPGYKDMIEKQRQTILSRRKDYKFKCKKCNTKYCLNLTPHQYNTQNYRKNCSRSCANSKSFSKKSKKKTSLTLKKYYKTHNHSRKGQKGHSHTEKTKKILSKIATKNENWKNFKKNVSHQRHHGNELIYKPYIEKYFNTNNLKPEKINKHWFDFVNKKYIIELTMSATGGADNAINRFKTIINDTRKKNLICPNIYFGQKRMERLIEINVKFINLEDIGVDNLKY